jgi:HSP20 family protein
MDIIDDPSSPKIIAIFELPGVKNDNITLQIKDKRLMVLGKRLDPFTEALAAARSTSDQASSTTNSLGNVTNLTPNAPTTPARGAASGFITPTMGKSIRELRYGSFFRSLPVPEGIKVSKLVCLIEALSR